MATPPSRRRAGLWPPVPPASPPPAGPPPVQPRKADAAVKRQSESSPRKQIVVDPPPGSAPSPGSPPWSDGASPPGRPRTVLEPFSNRPRRIRPASRKDPARVPTGRARPAPGSAPSPGSPAWSDRASPPEKTTTAAPALSLDFVSHFPPTTLYPHDRRRRPPDLAKMQKCEDFPSILRLPGLWPTHVRERRFPRRKRHRFSFGAHRPSAALRGIGLNRHKLHPASFYL